MVYKFVAVSVLYFGICQTAPSTLPKPCDFTAINPLVQKLDAAHSRLIIDIHSAYGMYRTHTDDKEVEDFLRNDSLRKSLEADYNDNPFMFLVTTIKQAITRWSQTITEIQASRTFEWAKTSYRASQCHALKAHPIWKIKEAFDAGQQFLQKSLEITVLQSLTHDRAWFDALHISVRVFFNTLQK